VIESDRSLVIFEYVFRDNLILTCGATHGLHLMVSTILAPNGVIFVEQYTYMIALHLFKEFPNIRVCEGLYMFNLFSVFILMLLYRFQYRWTPTGSTLINYMKSSPKSN
jgi:membrane protein implicated in regulation of membrane protease activity